MEQQTISVAKAGLVCKLNTRTTILAAANPKGHYDLEQSLCVNVALASPLLSRFDLVLVLVDSQNEDWDRHVSSYILENMDPRAASASSKSLWSMEKMQAYFALIKTIAPKLNQDSGRVLQAYYRAQRGADERNAARTSMRLLQSMIRLAQAHARLMTREEVTIQDAVVAVTVMESSMQGAALLGGMNVLHTSFPEDCEAEYMVQAEMILNCLGLSDLLEREMERLRQERAAAQQQGRDGGGEDPKGPAMQYSAAPPSQSSRDLCTTVAREQVLQGLSQLREGRSVREAEGGNQTSTKIRTGAFGSQAGVPGTLGRETLGSQRAVNDSTVLSQGTVGDRVVLDRKIDEDEFHQGISHSSENTGGHVQEESRGLRENAGVATPNSFSSPASDNQEQTSILNPQSGPNSCLQNATLQGLQELTDGVEGRFTQIREKGKVMMQGNPENEDSPALEPSNKSGVSPTKLQLLKKFSFVSKAKLSHNANLGAAGEGTEERDMDHATGSKQGQTAGAEVAQSATVPAESSSSISYTIQKLIDQRESRAQTKVTDAECREQRDFAGLPEGVDREARLVCVKDKGAGKTASGKTAKLVTKLKEKFNVANKDKSPFPTANIFSNEDEDDDDLFDLDIGFGVHSKILSKGKTKSAEQSNSKDDVSPQVSKKTKRRRGSDPDSAVDQERDAKQDGKLSGTPGKRSRISKPEQTPNPETNPNQSNQRESGSDISAEGSLRAVSSSTIQKLKNFSFGKSSSSSDDCSSRSDSKTMPLDQEETLNDRRLPQESSNALGVPSVDKVRQQHAGSSKDSWRSHKGMGAVMSAYAQVQGTQLSQRKSHRISESMLDSPLSSLASQPDVQLCSESSQPPLPAVGGTPSNSQIGNPALPVITSTPLSFLTDGEAFPPPSSSPVLKVANLAFLPQSKPGQVVPLDRCGTKGVVSDSQEFLSSPPPQPGFMVRVGHMNKLPQSLQSPAVVTTGTRGPGQNVDAQEEEVILNSQESLVSDQEETSSKQMVQVRPVSFAGHQPGKPGPGSLQSMFSTRSTSKPGWLVMLNAKSSQQRSPFSLDDKVDDLDDLDLELDFSKPLGTKPGRKS